MVSLFPRNPVQRRVPPQNQEEEHFHPGTHLNGARIFAYHIRAQHFKKTGGHQGLIGTAAVHYISGTNLFLADVDSRCNYSGWVGRGAKQM